MESESGNSREGRSARSASGEEAPCVVLLSKAVAEPSWRDKSGHRQNAKSPCKSTVCQSSRSNILTFSLSPPSATFPPRKRGETPCFWQHLCPCFPVSPSPSALLVELPVLRELKPLALGSRHCSSVSHVARTELTNALPSCSTNSNMGFLSLMPRIPRPALMHLDIDWQHLQKPWHAQEKMVQDSVVVHLPELALSVAGLGWRPGVLDPTL